MAEKGFILSAEEELKLREPIDEYIGKIQEQIDALRLDGTDKVRSLKNHIAFGARVIGIELAKMIVDEWLNAEYEGGRHQVRIDMIKDIEEKQKQK